MAEHADVGVRVAGFVEGVEENRLPGGPARADDEAGLGLEVRIEPGEERGERARVEDAGPLERVDTERCRGDPPLTLPERAPEEVTEGRAAGRLHLGRRGLQLSGPVGRDGEVQPDVEGAVLPGIHAPLQVLDRRQGPRDRRVGGAGPAELCGAQVNELPLQERDDPRGREPLRMPADRQAEAGRHEPQQPSRVQVAAGVAVDVPGAVQAGVVPPPAGGFLAAAGGAFVVRGRLVHVRRTEYPQGSRHRLRRPARGDEGDLAALGGRGGSEEAGEPQVLDTAVVEGRGDLVGPGLRLWSRRAALAGLEVDDHLEASVEAVEEGPEGRDPPAPVVLRSVQVSEGAGPDHDDVRWGAEEGTLGASPEMQRAHASWGAGAAGVAEPWAPLCASAWLGAGSAGTSTWAGTARVDAGSAVPGCEEAAGETV